MAISNVSSGLRPGVCTSTTRPQAPFEGQMIFETDTHRVLVWDNAAWVMIADTDTPPGLELAGTFTASGTSRALVCDNIFTENYENYKIVMKLATTANDNMLFAQFINTSGTTVNTSYFSTTYGRDYASATTGVTANGATGNINIGRIPNGATTPLSAEFTVYGPRLNEWTSINGQYSGIQSGVQYLGGEFYSVCNASPNTMRGIRIDNTQGTNLTGTVRVYGYRN